MTQRVILQKSRLFGEIIPTLLIVIFGVAAVARNLFPEGSMQRIGFIVIMAVVGGISHVYAFILRPCKRHIAVFYLLYCSIVLCSFFSENYTIYDYLMPAVYLGIGILLLEFRTDYVLIACYHLAIVLLFAAHGPKGLSQGIFHGSSRNYHSVYVLFSSLLVYIAAVKNGRDITVFPALTAFAISVLSIGRSGIVASGVLLVAVIVHRYYNDLKSSKYFRILLIAVLLSVAFVLSGPALYAFLSDKYLYRLQVLGLSDRARPAILREYIRLMLTSTRFFVFGVPTGQSHVFAAYKYNLHNSFLRLHSLFGLIGVIGVITLTLTSIVHYCRKRRIHWSAMGSPDTVKHS